MKIDLSCEIVRDLLPNYIDGLASKNTVEVVEAHLEECKDCNTIYMNMKEEESTKVHNEPDTEEAEKLLFKKINRKMNKKIKLTVLSGIAAILLVVGLMQLLFNISLKKVPVDEVSVSAEVYPVETLVAEKNQKQAEDQVYVSIIGINKEEQVVVSMDEITKDKATVTISIPDIPSSKIEVSKNLLAQEGYSYLSYISCDSPYILKDIDAEIQTVGEEQVMYIKGFKTTLLNNKSAGNGNAISMIEFQKVDQIVYIDEKGIEKVLWEGARE